MNRKEYNQIKGNGEMMQHNFICSRLSHSRGNAFKKIKSVRRKESYVKGLMRRLFSSGFGY